MQVAPERVTAFATQVEGLGVGEKGDADGVGDREFEAVADAVIEADGLGEVEEDELAEGRSIRNGIL